MSTDVLPFRAAGGQRFGGPANPRATGTRAAPVWAVCLIGDLREDKPAIARLAMSPLAANGSRRAAIAVARVIMRVELVSTPRPIDLLVRMRRQHQPPMKSGCPPSP